MMNPSLTLRAARAAYYEINGFGADGGDSLKTVPVKFLGITFPIPNTEGRRRAVKIHDLHHVVTQYPTTLVGEGEIGSWELATGCARFPAALVLNSLALSIGMLYSPRRMARAWARGRASTNLYVHDTVDALLDQRVDATRKSLGLDAPPPRAGLRDIAAVTVRGVLGLAVLASPLIALGALAYRLLG